jgi:hypothetical protein
MIINGNKNLEILELIKLHDKRKKYLSTVFNVSMKKIQSDTDDFINYIKSLNKETATKADILTFAKNNTESYFNKFFNWEETPEYRNAQCDFIISDKSIMFSSENEMVIIKPDIVTSIGIITSTGLI